MDSMAPARTAELQRARATLRQANDELERRIEERTAELQEAQQKALQAGRLAAIGRCSTRSSRWTTQRCAKPLPKLAG